ncbi:MAG: hypothetical protein ACR2F1_02565 [Nitrososphaeraceae archaeon]
MSKGITITSTIFGMFLLTLMATGIQIPTFSVFAQESEIESVNATNSGSGNATSAQETDIETVNATSSPSSNATSSESSNATSVAKAAQAKPDAATISAGESFAQQGTVTSTQDPLPGHEAHQLALMLPPRDDGAIYQGTLTYTASKPVEVVILQNFANETAVDPTYGGIATAPLGEGTVAISLLTPQYTGPISAASLPFAGNALALHTLNGEPFAATYTVTGDVEQAQTFNAVSPPPLAEATQADTGDGNDNKDDGDGGNDNKDDGDGGNDNKDDGDGGNDKKN